MSHLIVNASVAFLVLVSANAIAGSREQPIDFRYDSKDLTSPDGAAKVYARMASAANAECRTISNPPILNPRAEQCAKKLVDQLVARINSPLLTRQATQAVSLAVVAD